MKTETLYSRADWKFHKNRLGFDDVIDTKGRLVVTVSVMDIAIGEMFQPSYVDNEGPKELFVLEADGCWSIYLAVQWLTPANVQTALQSLGKLLGRTFVFEPYQVPTRLEARYRREAKAMRDSMEHLVPATTLLSKPGDAAKEQKSRLPSERRLAALLTHKLKA